MQNDITITGLCWPTASMTSALPVINKIVAGRMPGAVWHPVDGAGHFISVGSADEILAIAADEIGAQR